MPWTMAPGAPAYAYPIEVVRAMILGTPDAWLTDWLWLIGGVPTAVAPLCAAGPQECEAFTEADFLSAATSGNRAGLAINLLQLVPKLQCFVEQRLFSAYCENTTVEPGPGAWLTYDGAACGTGPDVWDCLIWSGTTPLPRDASELRMYVSSGGAATIALAVSWNSPMTTGVSADVAQSGRTASGYGGVDAVVGGTRVLNIAPYQSSGRDLYPFMVRRGGTPPAIQPYCAVIDYFGPTPGEPDTYDPPPVYQPPTAVAPPPGDYPDIAAVGAELDLIERKLEILLDDAANREVATLWPLVPVGGPFAVTNDTDISIPEGGGLVVAVTNIGNQTDESYGEPRRLHRLGRVTVGSSSGWLPPFDITVTPMMLVGLPLEVTRARVHVMSPAVAQVQILQRAQPVG